MFRPALIILMVRIFDDIYFYKHPIGANCNIYAFKDGKYIDLIDTGIKKLRIVKWLLKAMRKDGLHPEYIRKIVHPHYHFDHVQANSFFQEKIIRSPDPVPVYVPEQDLFRTKPDFDIFNWNINELRKRFGAENFVKSFKNYGRAFNLGGIIGKKMFETPAPKNIKVMNSGDIISLGQRTARVYCTGGHTEGHSFLFFEDEDRILYTGDHDALNEYTCDWGKTLQSVRLAQKLSPSNVFIGHNNVKFGAEVAQQWINSYFNQFETIFSPIIHNCQEGQIINLSRIIRKMMGWLAKIKGLDIWANMSIYAIGKHLENLKLGKLQLNSDNQGLFNFELLITQDPQSLDLINLIKHGTK